MEEISIFCWVARLPYLAFGDCGLSSPCSTVPCILDLNIYICIYIIWTDFVIFECFRNKSVLWNFSCVCLFLFCCILWLFTHWAFVAQPTFFLLFFLNFRFVDFLLLVQVSSYIGEVFLPFNPIIFFSDRTVTLVQFYDIFLYLVLLRSWCKYYFIWILFLFVRLIIIFHIIIWVYVQWYVLLGLLRVLVVLNLPIP